MFIKLLSASSRHTDAGIAMRLAPKVEIEKQIAHDDRIRAEARAQALAEAEEMARLAKIERAAKWEAQKRIYLAGESVQASKFEAGEEPIYRRHRTYLDIEATACRIFKVKPSLIKSKSRNRRLVFVRQFVMYWTARLTRLSLPQIGMRIGGRDHTTVLHGKDSYVEKRKAMKRTLRPAR